MESPDYKFEITDEARPYLVLQKGALWNLKDDHAAWDAAYNQSMNNTYRTIAPFLPEKCESVLDVGSGMGGIDAMLNRHYGGQIEVTLLDGVKDGPAVTSHSKTFNDMMFAKTFLEANGVINFDYISPADARDLHPHHKNTLHDLVISFGAWCFHFPPAMYLPFVKASSHPGTVLILDVRNDKPDWLDDLIAAFGMPRLIRKAEKFTKYAFDHE